jgi:hypothetical protein
MYKYICIFYTNYQMSCHCTTLKGQQCKNKPIENSRYCGVHRNCANDYEMKNNPHPEENDRKYVPVQCMCRTVKGVQCRKFAVKRALFCSTHKNCGNPMEDHKEEKVLVRSPPTERKEKEYKHKEEKVLVRSPPTERKEKEHKHKEEKVLVRSPPTERKEKEYKHKEEKVLVRSPPTERKEKERENKARKDEEKKHKEEKNRERKETKEIKERWCKLKKWEKHDIDFEFASAIYNHNRRKANKLLSEWGKILLRSRYVVVSLIPAGLLDILKIAYSMGKVKRTDTYVCIDAALNRQLGILKWAIEEGFPWDGSHHDKLVGIVGNTMDEIRFLATNPYLTNRKRVADFNKSLSLLEGVTHVKDIQKIIRDYL